jgi:transposase InsO family protein
MHELYIDTVGPFPRDEEGFIYVVVIIDSFTRYVTLHSCVDTTGRAAGTALFDHCCIYGVPKVIHTDNGSQNVNALISSLTKLFNVKHNLLIAYSSQENGICGRVNREVNRHLQMLTV